MIKSVRVIIVYLKAFLAAFTALSTSSLSASATLQMTSSVAGSKVEKVFPEAAVTNSLSMNNWVNLISGFWTGMMNLLRVIKKSC